MVWNTLITLPPLQVGAALIVFGAICYPKGSANLAFSALNHCYNAMLALDTLQDEFNAYYEAPLNDILPIRWLSSLHASLFRSTPADTQTQNDSALYQLAATAA